MDKANFLQEQTVLYSYKKKGGSTRWPDYTSGHVLIINDITGVTLVCLIRPMFYISMMCEKFYSLLYSRT